MQGGRTAHSMFKIPVDELHEDSFCQILKQSLLAGLICATCIVIWDEITMQDKLAPEAVDQTFHDLRDNNELFGGAVAVVGGDWQQILPVVRRGSCQDIVNARIR